MYPAHFAAALAVKGRVPQAPTWALATAIFLPDLLWIALARTGVEPELPPRGFFDDWSHSVLSIILIATLFACAFWKSGRPVAIGIWIAGLTHFPSDVLIHSARLALYPLSSTRFGWNLWQYGQQKSSLGPNHYWWIVAAVTITLLAVYALSSRRSLLQAKLVTAPACL